MKDADIVIGSNWGDEGKGATVQQLALKYPNSVVCRFNGGSQAGHTIELNGKRHVCSHIGAGVLCGNASLLARDFIVNPILFNMEWYELGSKPVVYVDSNCVVTVPLDMLINQAIERKRGNSRHGSCGVGIFETVNRTNHGVKIAVLDLVNGSYLDKLNSADFVSYYNKRLFELNLTFSDVITTNYTLLFEAFREDVKQFLERVIIVNSLEVMRQTDHIIFEGAQGLALDCQNESDFPHLTPSYTGITNVVHYMQQLLIAYNCDTTVHYVTRPYFTRHGPGKFVDCDISEYFNVVDKTNVPNNWQGTIRYGIFNFDEWYSRTMADFNQLRNGTATKQSSIRCLDQLTKDKFPIIINGKEIFVGPNQFCELIDGPKVKRVSI